MHLFSLAPLRGRKSGSRPGRRIIVDYEALIRHSRNKIERVGAERRASDRDLTLGRTIRTDRRIGGGERKEGQGHLRISLARVMTALESVDSTLSGPREDEARADDDKFERTN
jgi:hypothetical protein